MATDLIREFAGEHGIRRVLDGIDLVAAPGTRLGLVGENGSGKSTLLRILGGIDQPDRGTVAAPDDIVYLAQEPDETVTGTVGAMLDAALAPMHSATAELERLAVSLAADPEAAARYDEVLAWATHHDAWDADRRAEVIATALGVAGLERDKPIGELSGGQRTRLALAAALVRRPAVLLLDEPTNHLDDEALELLETSLVDLPGVVITASHDRTFLDRVCTDIFDLDAGVLGADGSGGRRFGGGFTDYLEHRAAARRRWEETWQAQQDELTRLRADSRITTEAVARGRGPRDNDKFIHAFKGANVERAYARRVRDAERKLEAAENDQLPKPPPLLRFSGHLATGAGEGVVVQVRDLVVGGRLRLPTLDVGRGDHLLVTGPNGCGKSTFLDVLAGRVSPTSGEVQIQACRVRLLSQDPQVSPDLTPQSAYTNAIGQERAEKFPLRRLGLLAPRDLERPVGQLSLGQRRRLDLAIAVAAAPDLLLLDEPSNHLSLSLVSEIEEAVAVSAGTVIVTSHDRWLRSRWNGTRYTLAPPRSRG